jgi:RNA-splicing ligase RtcB
MLEVKGKYCTAKIFADTIEDGVIQQVKDIVNCPAFKDQLVRCMPDVHVGASGPCGLVATIGEYVNPEHVGVDIGCEVSMVFLNKKLPLSLYADFESKVKDQVKFGQTIHSTSVVDRNEFIKFVQDGFRKYRLVWPEMLNNLPKNVDYKYISNVINRVGINEDYFWCSLGTVGGGNHYWEYNECNDNNEEHYAYSVHCGSRNFGLKVCKYWTKLSESGLSKNDIHKLTESLKIEYKSKHDSMNGFEKFLKDSIDLAKSKKITGYLSGDLLQGYLCDMCLAQLYAQFNHLTIEKIVNGILAEYDIYPIDRISCTHNFIDLHDHTLRKSAIRSYKGERLLVPFNMKSGTAVCVGKSNQDWLNGCAHGAGRKMSRTMAKSKISLEEFKLSMKGVYSTTVCESTIDESPMAYKDTDEIKRLISETADIKFMMLPKINIKATE